jgi:calpain-15
MEQVNAPIKVDQLIKEFEAKKMQFTDSDFPPELKSLSTRNLHPKWKDFEWKRPSQFLKPGEIQVFDDIDPNDIKQGELGDCYFLCCLSVLAEKPELVKRLFLTEKYTTAGIYGVWLNNNGNWEEIIIDDCFPCSRRSGLPAFTKSNGNELWVLILEKAYAKMYGSYDVIEGGHPSLALRDLTGAPYDFIESSDENEVWNYISDSNTKGYLITCYTKSTNVKEEQNPLGIVYGHAYSILDCAVVKGPRGNDRIVQVRNPWGKFEWTGDWGDRSALWTEDIKKQVNFKDAEDGEFWMSVRDFVKYYEGVGICKFHSEYLYKSIAFDHKVNKTSTSMVRLIVTKPTHIFLSLNQKDDRCYEEKQGYSYSLARIMLGKITPEGLKYIDGDFINDRNMVLEMAILEKGSYVITIEMLWSQNFYKVFNLSSYSKEEVHFEHIPAADIYLVQRNLLKSYILQSKPGSTDSVKFKDYGPKESRIHKYWGLVHGIAFFYFINNSLNRTKLCEKVDMTKLENLQICPPHTNNKSFNVTVLPYDDALVLYKCVKAGGEYTFSTQTACTFESVTSIEIENNKPKALLTTTYIDDPNDRGGFNSRENANFDKYIVKDVNPEANDDKNREEQDFEKQEQSNQDFVQASIGTAAPSTAGYNLKGQQVNLQIEGSDNLGSALLPGDPKSLTSVDVWADLPKNVKDNGELGPVRIQAFEENYCDLVDANTNKTWLNPVIAGLFAVFLVFPILLSFTRLDLLNLILSWFLFALVILQFKNVKIFGNLNIILRFYPVLLLGSCFFDLFALMNYLSKYDSTVFSFLSEFLLVDKAVYSLALWYKTIAALKYVS